MNEKREALELKVWVARVAGEIMNEAQKDAVKWALCSNIAEARSVVARTFRTIADNIEGGKYE